MCSPIAAWVGICAGECLMEATSNCGRAAGDCANAPETVFEGDFVRALGDYSVLDMPRKYYRQAQARDHLDRMLYMDVKIVLGDSDLPKVTRMTELAGIQVKFPLLDRLPVCVKLPALLVGSAD